MRYMPPDRQMRDRFHRGHCEEAYRFLGAHPKEAGGEMQWQFSVWAPNAKQVCLTGEFCAWQKDAYPMEKQYDGIWELSVSDRLFRPEQDLNQYNYPGAEEKLRSYKYAVLSKDDVWQLKADPYGFQSEERPHTASRLCILEDYVWQDAVWMEARAHRNAYRSPVNIYEMHLGTWKRGPHGEILNYSQLADALIPYLKKMAYTHVELLPVMEHPYDGSWGYQVTGYYAPTARYGTPNQFKELIDRLHRAGIGVILDWVPAHFPKDEAGLARFDGMPCYEHADPRRSEMPQWGTVLFDFGRGEACSFLLSNALFWLEEYHADGLRCDAVSCMLYHDFCKEEGQWLPNRDGGRTNEEAIAFLKTLNETAYRRCPGVMMIAEESSAYPGVTRPTYQGGLGFGFKWNMGWMNDTLAYIKEDPLYRKWSHEKMTFSLAYAFSENYILPFSHDEVVHLKKSMLDKQPGDLWQKFASLRALYGYTMAHPGKKLLFMGGEFGQFSEWKDYDQLDWFLLLYERHPQMQECVRTLNRLYKSLPALYQIDDSWEGFTWLNANDRDRSIFVFLRRAGRHHGVVCLSNFTPETYRNYRIGLPMHCELTEIFNSDSAVFDGKGYGNAAPIQTEAMPCVGFDYSCEVVVPPLATVYFKVRPKARTTQ